MLELGAGEGFFTELIAPLVRRVIAIDIDQVMISALRAKFGSVENVVVRRKSIGSKINFGSYDIVFGNIPFNRTADVFRKATSPHSGLESSHFIVQLEASYRLLNTVRPTTMAILAYPYYDIQKGINIPRHAYRPVPKVESCLLHIRRRERPLMELHQFTEFARFAKAVINSGNRKVRNVIGDGVSNLQWRKICASLGLRSDFTHLDLNPQLYVNLFTKLNATR